MGFPERLKELREQRGLSQEQLAETLKIPRSSITHYENSEDRMPRQKRLNELADFFGVSVDYLIGRADTDELTETEQKFVDGKNKMSLEEIIEKFAPEINGKPATAEQIKKAIEIIGLLQE